uniref:PH domain-containing protein n=1 Tax=Sarcophilus harrisii TaxID=9305 RepID=A0A7N4PLP8_SARHA
MRWVLATGREKTEGSRFVQLEPLTCMLGLVGMEVGAIQGSPCPQPSSGQGSQIKSVFPALVLEVGWPRASLDRLLLQDPALLRLVLKTVPVPKTAPQSPLEPIASSRNQSESLAPPSPRASEEKGSAFTFDQSPEPRLPSSSEAGPATPSDCGTSWGPDEARRSPSAPDPPPAAQPVMGEIANHGSPEPPDKGPSCSPKKSKAKGTATRLSRRRVSCRQLGQPDCDGWLLLRKVPGGFMGPRWRRCWMVLKGHTLYWYRQPQDEKAEGLINVSNYSLESGRDQKKKYVFQLTHNLYKPFIFAAETLADLSMWVSRLVTCISKYQFHSRGPAPREEGEGGFRGTGPFFPELWNEGPLSEMSLPHHHHILALPWISGTQERAAPSPQPPEPHAAPSFPPQTATAKPKRKIQMRKQGPGPPRPALGESGALPMEKPPHRPPPHKVAPRRPIAL